MMISPAENSIDSDGIDGNRNGHHHNNNGHNDNGVEKIMKHEKFIEALEKFGGDSDGNEWTKMATYLHMSVWDVKLYAYSYMHQLYESDNNHNNSDGGAMYYDESTIEPVSLEEEENPSFLLRQQQKPTLIPPDNNSMSDGYLTYEDDVEWTCDEAILFENLLALYLPIESNESISKWENISALMPNKTSIQCRNRYYSHIHNKILNM